MECEAMINSSTLLSGLLRACGTICILLILFLVSFDSWCFMSGLRVANDIPTLSLDDYKAGWEEVLGQHPIPHARAAPE